MSEGTNPENISSGWYVIYTYSGYENKVKATLEKLIANRGLQDKIEQIVIPMEEEIEIKDGKQKSSIKKVFPGYVLIKMTMTDESWHVVRNITGVTGFVGPGSEPTPLSAEEIERFNVETHTAELAFKVGDKVEVFAGIFAGYSGILQEINEEKSEVVILASTERRDIPIMVEIKDIRLAE